MTAPRRRWLSLFPAALILLIALPGVASAAPSRFEGRLVVAHGDDFGLTADSHGQRHSTWDYRLVTASGTYSLAFSHGVPSGFWNGAQVTVQGTRSGTTIAVGGNVSAQVNSPAPLAATGPRKIAVVLVNFVSNTATPWTTATAANTMFNSTTSVANYFGEESYGLMSVTGDVFGYYTIDFDTTGCNYTDLATKAKAAAAKAGVDLAPYTQIQYAFPWVAACGWAGLAYVPGRESWINNYLQLSVSSHELSHNFGVHHASTLSCTEGGVRVALSANLANCTASEYGDPFSVMGNGSKHTHSQQLATLGWATGSALQTVTTAGDYTLGNADDVASAVKSIRVARGNGTYLYLELRKPFGTFDNFSSSDPVVNGVTIRISNDWNTIIQSKLIDTTPATSTYNDAPLATGATFTDPLANVNITTVSVGGGNAVVHIAWGPDTVAPSTPGNLTASLVGGTGAHLAWTASSDNIGVTGYQVSRDGTVLGTTTGTTWDQSGLATNTTYVYSVVAFDGAGNTSAAASKSLFVPVADTTAPGNPTNFRVSTLTKAKVAFTWGAATDNVAVAGYRIYRGSTLVATTTSLTWSDTHQRAATTYTIKAFDAAGNVSSGVTVTVAAK
jgi:hypothetical protein